MYGPETYTAMPGDPVACVQKSAWCDRAFMSKARDGTYHKYYQALPYHVR